MKTNAIEGPLMAMVEGRFVRVDISVRDLGPQDSIVQKLAADLPTNMLNAFLLPGGKPAHIQTKAGVIIVWTELNKLQLRTVYTVGRDGTRYPVFKRPESMTSPPEHEASFEWDPSVIGMRMFFTSTLKFEPAAKTYVWNQSYLVCKAPKRKEIFRPPMPNTYTDGRICMGNDYRHTGPCLADVFCHNLAHFDASKWNNDLSDGITADHVKAMFSFDKDDKQIPPPKEYKWWENPAANPTNNLNYGELPLV